jgi:hypothetical protein
VVRQRGLAHSYRVGEFPLVGGLADLQVEQDQPDRPDAARFAENLVERALYGAGRLASAEPQSGGETVPAHQQACTKH